MATFLKVRLTKSRRRVAGGGRVRGERGLGRPAGPAVQAVLPQRQEVPAGDAGGFGVGGDDRQARAGEVGKGFDVGRVCRAG